MDKVTDNQLIHENISHATVPLQPEILFGQNTPLHLTNSLLSGWFSLALILVLVYFVLLDFTKRKNSRLLVGVMILIEYLYDFADTITQSREKTKKIFPLFFSLFIFILINNWLGIIPLVGTVMYKTHEGFVPLLRGMNADLSATLALALGSLAIAHVAGILSVGFFKYSNKYFNFGIIISSIKNIRKNPSGILVAIITFFVGLIELVGEFAKVASLSFRLFGNIFAGEVLLVSISALSMWLAPVPFLFLEIIVGVIQALVFSTLALVYVSLSLDEPH